MTAEDFVNLAIGVNVFAAAWFGAQNKMFKAYYHLVVALILAILLWGQK
jgi:hypothetical protein